MKKSFLFILLLTAGILSAQTINSVSFQENGDYKFGKDVLKLYIQSRKGAAYDDRVVNDDIKRLHSTGFFSDVVSETVRRPDGSIDLIFKVIPQNTVNKIIFKGNRKYDDAKLRSTILFSEGAPLNHKRIYESSTAIRKLYDDAGHGETVITPRIRRKKDGKVEVEFIIKEKLNLKIRSVTFKGAKLFSQDDLKDSIQNKYSWLHWVPLLELGRLEKKELQNDVVRIRDKYWDCGYLDFVVKDIQLNTPKDEPDFVDIVFIIDEGRPYKVGNIRIEDSKRFTARELAPYLRMKKGDTYRVSMERSSLKGIEGKYSPLGYIDFHGNVEKLPDYRTHTVDLVFHVSEGEPFKVREVYISGNKWTKDHVIRRELVIAPGDPVDKNRISASKSRLMGMGYFKKVDALSHNSPEKGTKDVDIIVEEKNFLNARLGGGFSDTDGIAGMVELSHTNMDILDPKNYFTGGGQRARILTMIGTERFNLEADFTEPWLFGQQLRWDLSGYMRNFTYEDWEEARVGLTTSLTKRIFDDFTSIAGGYTFEYVRIHHMEDDMSAYFQKQEGGNYVGRFHLALDRDTRDNAMAPTSGYHVNLYGGVTSKIFGASYDYYRFEVKGINHYSFFDKMFILSTGIKAGFLGSIGSSDDIPLYERYFLGGGDSLRGFPYRSVGPTDKRNDNYGGEFMYLGTTELSHPIYKFIRGAVFMDIGNATDSRAGPFSDPNIGVGYGLRLQLPGINAPIRLDLAFPVMNNQDNVSNSLRFHFNMGFALF